MNPKIVPQIAPKLKETQRCFQCEAFGHIEFECPNKSVVTLLEYQASFEDEMELDGNEEEVYLSEALEKVIEGPDKGELLMVRIALIGFATQEGNEQREAIFHIRCTIGGKVCSLIID